jgi:hypothetical protein
MPFKTNGCSTYIALGLAIIVAILSAPGRADETYQALHVLLSACAPQAAAIAAAMNSDSRSFAAP